MVNTKIRPIQPGDNSFLAIIVRQSLAEFGVNKPGTVYYDNSTDHLYELFQTRGAAYFVATDGQEVLGGAGIFPSNGLPADICELVKMYLKKHARGCGLGRLLMEKCIQFAKENNYKGIYIETMPELKDAILMYKKYGFKNLDGPLGNTGHYGCDVWMKKEI
jgi:putative acetyltransferase